MSDTREDIIKEILGPSADIERSQGILNDIKEKSETMLSKEEKTLYLNSFKRASRCADELYHLLSNYPLNRLRTDIPDYDNLLEASDFLQLNLSSYIESFDDVKYLRIMDFVMEQLYIKLFKSLLAVDSNYPYIDKIYQLLDQYFKLGPQSKEAVRKRLSKIVKSL